MKHLLTFFILTVLIVSGLGKAGLTLQSTQSTLKTELKDTTKSYYTYIGPQKTIAFPYVGNPYGAQTQVQIYNDISTTQDTITNSVTTKKYGHISTALQHLYTYDSMIEFLVTEKDGFNRAFLSMNAGNLYIDGNLIEPTDGLYTVPLNTLIVAKWNYSYTAPYILQWSNADTKTASQSIALTGYQNVVPEPSTICMLTIGSLITFWKRRIA